MMCWKCWKYTHAATQLESYLFTLVLVAFMLMVFDILLLGLGLGVSMPSSLLEPPPPRLLLLLFRTSVATWFCCGSWLGVFGCGHNSAQTCGRSVTFTTNQYCITQFPSTLSCWVRKVLIPQSLKLEDYHSVAHQFFSLIQCSWSYVTTPSARLK